MKTCTYCGKVYPDEATVCAIDQNSLQSADHLSAPKPKERKVFKCVLRCVLTGLIGLVAFAWGLLAVSHKCSLGSRIFETSFPWFFAVLSSAAILFSSRYALVFFFIAPPFAVIFTLGILWKRANALGAVATIIAGFAFTWVVTQFELLGAYNTFNHRALAAWIFCMSVMIVVSLLTAPPPENKIKGIIWNRSYLTLPPDIQARHRGLQDWRIWWLLFVGIVLSIYGFFIWWRIQHPW